MRSQSGISPAHSCSLQTHVPGVRSAPAPWFLSQPFPFSYPRLESANRSFIVYDRACRECSGVRHRPALVTLKKSLAGEVCPRWSCCWPLRAATIPSSWLLWVDRAEGTGRVPHTEGIPGRRGRKWRQGIPHLHLVLPSWSRFNRREVT